MALGEIATAFGRQAPRIVNNVVVGGGMATATILSGLSRSKTPGKVLVIAKALSWPAVMPRHHRLGQSRQGLLLGRNTHDPYYLKQNMTAEEYMRQQVDSQMKAVELLPDDSDCIETDLRRVIRQGNRLLLTCGDGSSVLTDKLFLATGVGPERTLQRSDVLFENEVSPKRQVYHEVTTALQSMQEQPEYWRGKTVTVYGGGPTAAWIVEVAMSYSLKNILWIAKGGFAGANPSGRNSETIQMTEGHRLTSAIRSLRYEGGGNTPPEGGGILLTLDNDRAKWTQKTDIVICATGSDPMAPTGVQSMLGGLYRDLQPHTGRNKGVFARTEDGSIFVVSSALTGEETVRKMIVNETYTVLNAENHVVAGMAVANLSAMDAVEVATSSNKS